MSHGKQIGTIVYGAGINARHYVNDAINRGYVVVWCAGYAAIYARA